MNAIQRSDDHVLTVTELTREIKRRLERDWAAVWVEGELSNVTRSAAGHVYFTVKDEGASLRGVMWRSRARTLRFDPEAGQKVRVCGGISVYEPRGEYQISAIKLEPVGVGELEIAFRQLHDRLEKEGLFDSEHKTDVPEHPRTIGIVTSPTGAALRDLFSVLGRRAPHVKLVVRPAQVQGRGAAEDVAEGIAELDRWGGCDVLIVGRGGGSLEDLWAFNEEVLVRAIFACRTPVISAVGHEIDTTISDLVADLRAPTPSAAAELAAPDREELLEEVRGLGGRLLPGMRTFLRERRRSVILAARSPAFRSPLEFYRRRSQDTDRLRARLDAAAERRSERGRLKWEALAGKLDALSPLAILGRGYAIARRPDGTVVRRAGDLERGDPIDVRLAEGEISCIVEGCREVGDAAGANATESRGEN